MKNILTKKNNSKISNKMDVANKIVDINAFKLASNDDFADVADDTEVSVSMKSLYMLMIVQTLIESRKSLSIREICDKIEREYSYILMDEEIDANTISRYMKDLVSADYLSYKVFSEKSDNYLVNTNDSIVRYYVRKNDEIKQFPDKLNNRIKPACIYDVLYRNVGMPMSAKEIAEKMNKCVSEKTVRETISKNEFYTENNNFWFMVFSDEFRGNTGKIVNKFVAEYSNLGFRNIA